MFVPLASICSDTRHAPLLTIAHHLLVVSTDAAISIRAAEVRPRLERVHTSPVLARSLDLFLPPPANHRDRNCDESCTTIHAKQEGAIALECI